MPKISSITLAAVVAAGFVTPTLACSPAPSCWIGEGPAYLKEICKGYAKDGRTIQEIKTWLDEPEKAQEFAAACKTVGVKLKNK